MKNDQIGDSVSNIMKFSFGFKGTVTDMTSQYGSFFQRIHNYWRCLLLTNLPLEDKGHFLSSFVEKSDHFLKIENLNFGYSSLENEDLVLKGVNLSIKRGEKVALIRRTGSGKSTLFKLLCGSFTNYNGKITIKGRNLKEISLKNYRSKTKILLQDSFIFSDTLKSNMNPLKIYKEEELIEKLKKVK